jgi:hypothetical protein
MMPVIDQREYVICRARVRTAGFARMPDGQRRPDDGTRAIARLNTL